MSLSASVVTEIENIVNEILTRDQINLSETVTKSGWCLKAGLSHVIAAKKMSLKLVVLENGMPKMYEKSLKCQNIKENDSAVFNMKTPSNCFESLCRIVAGQQLAGASAQTIWNRLLETTTADGGLKPHIIIRLAEISLEEKLQKPSGLSKAKANTILNLAKKFHEKDLDDSFFENESEKEIRRALLDIKGIGPWSCDMFLMFYLERPDILPLGDLGVRKGIAKHFGLRGSGKQGSLCPVKDLEKIKKVTDSYKPFRSVFSYYMWKVLDATGPLRVNKEK